MADKESRILTDEEFLKWCGSHSMKGCGTERVMDCEAPPDRLVSRCEDCRSEAQDTKTRMETLKEVGEEVIEPILGFYIESERNKQFALELWRQFKKVALKSGTMPDKVKRNTSADPELGME